MTDTKKLLITLIVILANTLPEALRADEICPDFKAKKDEILRLAIEASVNQDDSSFAGVELELKSTKSIAISASLNPGYNFPPARIAIEATMDVGVAEFEVIHSNTRRSEPFLAKCDTQMMRVDECDQQDPRYIFVLVDCSVKQGGKRVLRDMFRGPSWFVPRKQVAGQAVFSVDNSYGTLSLNLD